VIRGSAMIDLNLNAAVVYLSGLLAARLHAPEEEGQRRRQHDCVADGEQQGPKSAAQCAPSLSGHRWGSLEQGVPLHYRPEHPSLEWIPVRNGRYVPPLRHFGGKKVRNAID